MDISFSPEFQGKHQRPSCDDEDDCDSTGSQNKRTNPPGGPPITCTLEPPSNGHRRVLPDLRLSPRKLRLFQDLFAVLEGHGPATKSREQWPMSEIRSDQQCVLASIGMLSVMDDEAFERWAEPYGDAFGYEAATHFRLEYGAMARKVLNVWAQRRTVRHELVNERDREAHGHALERSNEFIEAQQTVSQSYNETCMTTGISGFDIEACPIIPDSLTRFFTRKRTEGRYDSYFDYDLDLLDFWCSLPAFFPRKICKEIEETIRKPGYERTNMLILNELSAEAWMEARIAFCPVDIGADLNDLWFRFFYLNHPKDPADGVGYGYDDAFLHHDLRQRCLAPLWRIGPGDIIRIHPRDATSYPLPDFRFLELQWQLNRAMYAASHPKLLRLLFHNNGHDDSSERAERPGCPDVDDFHPRNLRPVRHTPFLSLYFIDCALEQGLIQPADVPIWRARLDPEGWISEESPARYGYSDCSSQSSVTLDGDDEPPSAS